MEFGRDPAAINITAFAPHGLDRKGGEAAEIRRAGADRLVVPLQSENQGALLAELEELAGALL